MFTADPLYGGAELPDWLSELIKAPEVQRLRGIRLINTSSPSLAALSDARRYTHTLGMLQLGLVAMARLSDAVEPDVSRSFLASAVSHDIGTPAFGHTFEYLLNAASGWSHEWIVESVLNGDYRPERAYHQILPGRQLGLRQALERHDIDPAVVARTVRGQGQLAPILAGSVDIDNIDNVWRMASLLGLSVRADDAVALAGCFAGDQHGVAFVEGAVPLLERWAELRRTAYQVLVFEETNMKGQAMLTDCLTDAMDAELLGEEHWFFTDEVLLGRLLEFGGRTKETAERLIAGDLYTTIFVGWYDVPQGAIDLRQPQARKSLRLALESELRVPCSPYIFYDNGTFAKELYTRLTTGPGTWVKIGGEMSRSTVVGVYTPRATVRGDLGRAARRVLAEFGYPDDALLRIPPKESIYGLAGQTQLPI